MKKMSASILFLFFVAAAMLLPRDASPYSYSAWGPMSGARTLSVNPLVYGPFYDFGLSTDLVVSYGFTDRFDIFVDLASLDVAPEFGYAGSWVMPRVGLGENHVLGLQMGFDSVDPFSFYLAPQYHFFGENEKLALEFNLGVYVPFSEPETSEIYAVAVPVYKVKSDVFALYVEVDPYYTFGADGGFGLNIVPGLWLGFGEEAAHQISFGLILESVTSGDLSLSYGFWYWTSFSL